MKLTRTVEAAALAAGVSVAGSSPRVSEDGAPCWLCGRRTRIRTDRDGRLVECCGACAKEILELKRKADLLDSQAATALPDQCPNCEKSLKGDRRLKEEAAERRRQMPEHGDDVYDYTRRRLLDVGYYLTDRTIRHWDFATRRTVAVWLNVVNEGGAIPAPRFLLSYKMGRS